MALVSLQRGDRDEALRYARQATSVAPDGRSWGVRVRVATTLGVVDDEPPSELALDPDLRLARRDRDGSAGLGRGCCTHGGPRGRTEPARGHASPCQRLDRDPVPRDRCGRSRTPRNRDPRRDRDGQPLLQHGTPRPRRGSAGTGTSTGPGGRPRARPIHQSRRSAGARAHRHLPGSTRPGSRGLGSPPGSRHSHPPCAACAARRTRGLRRRS